MTGKKMLNIVLAVLSLCLALVWLTFGLEAGISGDEYVHHKHADDVIDYYMSFGKNRAALNTPVSNLKYYGQAYDNMAAAIVRLSGVDNVFTVRHILSIAAGWLIVIYAFLLGQLAGGRWVGIVTAVFLLLSPRFVGHSFNNLKDIPFALAYLMAVFYTVKWIRQLPNTSFANDIMLTISIAFAVSIRPSGLLMLCYFGLFVLIWFYGHRDRMTFIGLIKNAAFIVFTAYVSGILFWPYALENPFWHPLESHFIMADYPVTLRQLFEGKLYWSDQLPRYYLFKFFAITMPLPVLGLFILSPLLFAKNIRKTLDKPILYILCFVVVFPLLFILIQASNLYGGTRHLLFIYPIVCVLAALILVQILKSELKLIVKMCLVTAVLAGVYHPLAYSIKNHPLQYTYFNSLVGGIKGTQGKYETDYYYASLRQGSLRLMDSLEKNNDRDTVTIASNFRIDSYVKHTDRIIKCIYTPYYNRSNVNWDYGLFVPAQLHAFNAKSLHWPGRDVLFDIRADDVPLCIALKRFDRNDFKAFEALNKNEYKKALDLASKAMAFNPNNLGAALTLGKAHLAMEQYNSAAHAFHTCLYVLPDYEPAKYYLALIEKHRHRYNKSIILLNEILKFNSKYTAAHLLLADIYILSNKYASAEKVLEEALKITPYDRVLKRKLETVKSKYQY